MIRVVLILLCFISLNVKAQDGENFIDFRGQLSIWGNYNNASDNYAFGGRYIPQLNAGAGNDKNLLDMELSANMFANFIGDDYEPDAKIKPYRAWLRFSTRQFELRAGLQKINFGSAKILRPLMWFDQVDPRDPLQLTDGVYGLLARYYFLNNANIWLWGLYGNNDPKGWEYTGTYDKTPEFGGRVQLPAWSGEVALTYHHRKTSAGDELMFPFWDKASENRLGIDAGFDWVIGFWGEASYSNTSIEQETKYNQLLSNVGADYTFDIGNGLHLVFEQLIASFGNEAFSFSNSYNFSLLSTSYPISLFDNINYVMYYSWDTEKMYNFINYQRQYNNLSFNIMAYWNPDDFVLPQPGMQNNMFAGKGMQLMIVYTH